MRGSFDTALAASARETPAATGDEAACTRSESGRAAANTVMALQEDRTAAQTSQRGNAAFEE